MSTRILGEDVEKKFPSNSKHVKPAEKKEERPKVEAVVAGKKRKKTLGRKLTETFIGEDIDNVSQYIIHDVLIPAAKNTITDMVQGGIEMLLFGERKGSRTTRNGNRSYVSYNNYAGSRNDTRRDDRRDISNRGRATHDFDEVIFDSRGEAEMVLSNLVTLVEDYGTATVSDFYDLCGITGNFTDNKYGWTNLNTACVDRVRDGYVIKLPKTKAVD